MRELLSGIWLPLSPSFNFGLDLVGSTHTFTQAWATTRQDACKKKSEDKRLVHISSRPSSRRHYAKVTTHEREAREDLFEIEDAEYSFCNKFRVLFECL
ncbi:hypothetical protein K1719_032826 [Acacia pycnantha]|nr:hypothetical protein K1719_032826 [Acacia pycnantha]